MLHFSTRRSRPVSALMSKSSPTARRVNPINEPAEGSASPIGEFRAFYGGPGARTSRSHARLVRPSPSCASGASSSSRSRTLLRRRAERIGEIGSRSRTQRLGSSSTETTRINAADFTSRSATGRRVLRGISATARALRRGQLQALFERASGQTEGGTMSVTPARRDPAERHACSEDPRAVDNGKPAAGREPRLRGLPATSRSSTPLSPAGSGGRRVEPIGSEEWGARDAPHRPRNTRARADGRPRMAADPQYNNDVGSDRIPAAEADTSSATAGRRGDLRARAAAFVPRRSSVAAFPQARLRRDHARGPTASPFDGPQAGGRSTSGRDRDAKPLPHRTGRSWSAPYYHRDIHPPTELHLRERGSSR